MLAATFHFQPSELDALELIELIRWCEQAKRLHDAAASRTNRS